MSSSERRVIYIAGYSYSGSTLLDVFFSSLENAIGLGEVSRADREKKRRYYRLMELDDEFIDFWHYILWGDFKEKFEEREVDRNNLLRKLEDNNGLFGKMFFEEAFEFFDSKFIVDSSKTTPRNLFRPLYLRAVDLNVSIIHPVRNPIWLLSSYHRKGKGDFFSQLNEFIKWFSSTLITYVLYRNSDYLVIKLEDLLNDPKCCLNSINKKLELPVEEIENRIEKEKPLEQSGGFLGNNMRRDDEIHFDPPDREDREPALISFVIGAFGLPIYWFLS